MEIIARANDRNISRTAWAIRLKIEEHCGDYISNNTLKFRNLILKIDSNNVINVKLHANRCCQRTIAVSLKRLGRLRQNRSSI